MDPYDQLKLTGIKFTLTPSLLQIFSARRREKADCLSALDGSEDR
jgi:hypothetical protein